MKICRNFKTRIGRTQEAGKEDFLRVVRALILHPPKARQSHESCIVHYSIQLGSLIGSQN